MCTIFSIDSVSILSDLVTILGFIVGICALRRETQLMKRERTITTFEAHIEELLDLFTAADHEILRMQRLIFQQLDNDAIDDLENHEKMLDLATPLEMIVKNICYRLDFAEGIFPENLYTEAFTITSTLNDLISAVRENGSGGKRFLGDKTESKKMLELFSDCLKMTWDKKECFRKKAKIIATKYKVKIEDVL